MAAAIGILLFAGLIWIAVELFGRARALDRRLAAAETAPVTVTLAVPGASRVRQITATADLVVAHIDMADGTERLVSLDPATGRLVATILLGGDAGAASAEDQGDEEE